jgi:hypothetical protein
MLPVPAVLPPANLTAPCPELEPVPEAADLGDLLQESINLAVDYRRCAARHNELADWVKGASK